MELFVIVLLGCVTLVPAVVSGTGLAHTRQELADDGNWWDSAVFYQLLPRSFRDSDGDGNGDLLGLLEQFDHLIELGVTGICLGPVFRSPMRDGGYDVSSFRDIDPMYGTMDQFEDLLLRAKAAGIRVVLDLVPNHTSEQHEWFQKSVHNDEGYRNYYIMQPDVEVEDEQKNMVPNNWMSVYHTSAWTKNARGNDYYLHQFGETEPDLNFRSTKVKQEMEDIIRFWLDRGVDGLRFQRVDHLFEDSELRDEPLIDPDGSMNYANMDHIHTRDLSENYYLAFDWRTVFDEYPAEDNTGDERLMITSAYSSDLQSTLKWFGIGNRKGAHIAQNIGFLQTLSNDTRSEDLKRIIDAWLAAMPANGVANWVLGDNDHPRMVSRFGRERAAGLAMLCLTLPGTVFMFYGDEIGMEDNADITWKQTLDPLGCNTNATVYQRYSRDPARTPFQWDGSNEWAGFSSSFIGNDIEPWLPVHRNYRVCNLAHEKTSNRSMFGLYRDLIWFRQRSETMRHGTYQSFVLPNNVFAVLRFLPGDKTYATVLNVNAQPTSFDLSHVHRYATQARVAFVSPGGIRSKGEAMDDVRKIALGAYETIILELRSNAVCFTSTNVVIIAILGVGMIFNYCRKL